MQGLIESASEPTEGIVATIVSIVLLIIGATTVFGELQSDLDRIWRAPATQQQSGIWTLLRTRLLSLGMVLAIGFLLLISLVLSAGLAALGKWWGGLFGGWEVLLHVINFIVSFAIITGLFAMIYKILPRVDIAWRDVWIGAAVTALLFTIGKLLIGLYIGKSGVASGFGAAGSFVVLLIWVYYSTQIFLLGAEFTWVYSHEHGSRSGAEAPGPALAIPLQSGAAAPEPLAPAKQAPSASSPPTLKGVPVAVTPTPITSAKPGGAGIGVQAREFFRENPVKGLVMIAAAGLVLGGVLREVTSRRGATDPTPKTHAPARTLFAARGPKNRSLAAALFGKSKADSGRGLVRRAIHAVLPPLLAMRLRVARKAAKTETLVKRVKRWLAAYWVDLTRRVSH